jgi:hypothetical protein
MLRRKKMKKYSWILALFTALTMAFVFASCGDGGGDGPGPGPGGGFDWGEEPGMQPTMYGSSQPVWDPVEETITITGGSSTGFSWTWAELSTAAGQTISSTGGNLLVTYIIDVKTPAAALTIKNPADMSANPGAPAGWGQGKGSEYVLGDNTLSNYDVGGEKIVASFYNPTTKRGWFEINPAVYSNATGIGFQHNFWCDMGGLNAENSLYTLKILRIAPRCCDTCDITTSKDCLAGNCIDDCYDETDNPTGTCCLPAAVVSPFVPVTGITGVPTSGLVGADIALTGTVAPANADNKTIAWSVKDAGTTGATISGSTLTTTATGTVSVTATIENGLTETTDYTQDFSITITGFLVSAPELEVSPGNTHSTWSGTPASGKENEFTVSVGGIRFAWADVDDATFDIGDYDFVAVYYTASGVNSLVMKQYSSSGDYPAFSGGISNGSGSFVMEIGKATSDGFAIQKYAAGSSDMTISFDKLVFYQGTRYDVTLNANSGTVSPTSLTLVDGTRVGNLPTPTRASFIFMGWKLGSTVITATTVVDSSFNNATLTADWRGFVAQSPINVSFTNEDELTTVGAGTEVALITNGYNFKYGSGGYDGSWVKFTITLPTGAILADYDKVTVTMEGKAGDTTYKQVKLLAGAPLPDSFSADPKDGPYDMSGDVQYGTGSQAMTFTIIKGRASALEGEIELSIYDRCGNTGSGATTEFDITNIVLTQN